VSLVENYIMEWNFLEVVEANFNRVVCGDAYVEVARLHFVSQNLFSLVFGWDQVDDSKKWSPLLKLSHPVRNRRLWSDDQVRCISNLDSLMEVS
jgi:hypothetical protein